MMNWTAFVDLCQGAGRLSAQATVVVVVIVGVQWAARRWLTPQWRYALWAVLLLRLVMVFAVPAGFSIHNATQWAAASPVPQSHAATPKPNASLVAPSVASSPTQQAPSARAEAGSVRDVVALVWLLGMVVLGGIVFLQSYRATRAVSRGTLVTDPATLKLLETCRKAVRLQTWLVLVETSAVKTPTLMGALRPRLLLPKGLLGSVPQEQLRHIFLHELMHLKRGDIWTGWMMNFLQVVHWFNPVFWWARRRILCDRECACDAAVLATLANRDRTAYGETMLDLAERLVFPSRWAPGMAGILETSDNLRRRIDMVTQFKPRTRTATLLGATLLVILGAVGLTDAQSAAPVLSAEKAEMMGRVEDFFCHNFRDISAKKSLEWGEVEKADDGTRSIRYMCEARIWDKETMIMNRVFTFKADGEFVASKEMEGYPKAKGAKPASTATREDMEALVEDFFEHNGRDIDSRKALEWGDVEIGEDGNRSIRYKFEAKIGDQILILDKRFTFKPDGSFVSMEDVKDAPKKGE